MFEVFVENIGCVRTAISTRKEACDLALWYTDTRGDHAWVFLDGDLVFESELVIDPRIAQILAE